ncbi:hypothetical protein [Lyngbya sp. CCY1209]|nr:hypothetical protein [Lyngbya sp. CCY1209]
MAYLGERERSRSRSRSTGRPTPKHYTGGTYRPAFNGLKINLC